MKNLLLINLIFFFCATFPSCKKKSNTLTTVTFHLFNPATKEGFSDVKVTILLKKMKSKPLVLEPSYESSILWEGFTDANGNVSYSFEAIKNNKYQYWTVVDNDLLNSYEAIIQPQFEPLNKDVSNLAEYQLTKKVNYIKWLKNASFYDSNDQSSFRVKGLLYPWEEWGIWSPVIMGDLNLKTSIINANQNVWAIEMFTIRNGISTTISDTFYLNGQVAVDTMKLFY